MAKIYGLFGSMTGKVADVVMSVRNGEQIARKYQPVVANPSTPLQVASRARLKLMSQLSAVVSDMVAFRRIGTVSPRNIFVKRNYDKTTYNAGTETASIAMASLDLTGGVLGLPGVAVERTAGGAFLRMSEALVNYDKVVYGVVVEQGDGTLRSAGVSVVSNPGDENVYPSTGFTMGSEGRTGYGYAYGIRLNTESAKARFGNLTDDNPNAILSVIRTLNEGDYSLSETTAVAIPAYGE